MQKKKEKAAEEAREMRKRRIRKEEEKAAKAIEKNENISVKDEVVQFRNKCNKKITNLENIKTYWVKGWVFPLALPCTMHISL